jgi:uncharacterized protein (DUF3084 family)
MLTPIILVLGLMLATAVIAYWSDNLGKKLGKKRVSLWNLRPRTTATLLTIVSSWVIMLFTLAVLLAVFRPLRHALLRYDRERAENRSLRQELTSLNGNVKKLETQRAQLQDQTKQISKNLKESGERLRLAQSGEKAARRGETQARQQESRARRAESLARGAETRARQNESRARQGEAQARQRVIDVRQRFVDTKEQLDVARQQFSSINSQWISARRNLNSARKQLHTIKSTLSRTREMLNQTRSDLTVSKNNLNIAQNNVRETQKSVREQLKRIATFELTIAQQESRLSELQAQVVDAELQVAVLNEELDFAEVARTGRTTIPYNLTFASRTIDMRAAGSNATQPIQALMDEARQNARTNYGNLPLQLEPIAIRSGDNPRLLTEDQVVTMLADYLQTFDVPVSVRVVSVRDHAVGEPIIKTQFVAVPVRTAMRTGDTLAQVTVDGRQSDAQIFGQLQKLIDAGRQFAEREKGIEPAFTRDSPNYYASGTNERIFEALRKVQTAKRLVTVRLVAAEDLSTVEALRVRFEIGDETV